MKILYLLIGLHFIKITIMSDMHTHRAITPFKLT